MQNGVKVQKYRKYFDCKYLFRIKRLFDSLCHFFQDTGGFEYYSPKLCVFLGMNKRRILFAVSFLLFALALSSCTSDYHYAKSFLRKHRRGTKKATEVIYVHVPKMVHHYNPSVDAVPGFYYMTYEQQDSVIRSLTTILDRLNDSIYLSQFSSSMLYTLSKTGIPIVLVDDEAQLPPPSKDALILDVTAVEAEEFVERTRSDFYTKNGVYYAYDYDLRHFATNVWFQLNYDTCYYFKSHEVSEAANRRGTVLSLHSQKATVKVEYDRINVNDAYRSAREMGQYCACLYIEKVLHEYVNSQKGANKWYLYYDYHDNDIHVMIPYETGIQESFEKVE